MVREKVLQDWMADLSWKQQSTLLSSLRGPDNYKTIYLKKINKWIRKITQNNADPSNNYMKQEELPDLEDICSEIEYCSLHYALHLLYGLEIISYKHPDKPISSKAEYYYQGILKKFHLNPETKEQMEERLKDKI
jgi:hypothetical protein